MERRQFTRELKVEAVRLIKDRGVSYVQAAQDLGVHVLSQLRDWVKKFSDDPLRRAAFSSSRTDPAAPRPLKDFRQFRRSCFARHSERTQNASAPMCFIQRPLVPEIPIFFFRFQTPCSHDQGSL